MALQNWEQGQPCTAPPRLPEGVQLVPEDVMRYAQQPAAAACCPSIHPSVYVPARLARPGPQPLGSSDLPGLCVKAA